MVLSTSIKSRFTTPDVRAMVRDLRGTSMMGKRLANIYDISEKAYLFKFSMDGNDKCMLLVESGVRFHLTTYTRELPDMPSPFTMKLRKHLRTKRLEDIKQLGNDRIIILTFGCGESRSFVILELFANGNIVLTDKDFIVLALLRSHQFSADVHLRVDSVYRTEVDSDIHSVLQKLSSNSATLNLHFSTVEAFKQWAVSKLEENLSVESEKEIQSDLQGKKRKKGKPFSLKQLLLSKGSGMEICGPDIIEHCIISAGLSPTMKVDTLLSDGLNSQLQALFDQLPQAFSLLSQLELPGQQGFIVARSSPSNLSQKHDGITSNEGENEIDEVEYLEFMPLLLKQYEREVSEGSDKRLLRFPSFEQAVDEYFARVEAQRLRRQTKEAQMAAERRIRKVRHEHRKALKQLMLHQQTLQKAASILEIYSDDVDKVLLVLNSAINAGLSWQDIEEMVERETEAGNPIARLVHRLNLDKNSVILRLEDTIGDDEPVAESDISSGEESQEDVAELKNRAKQQEKKGGKKLAKQLPRKVDRSEELDGPKTVEVEVDLSLTAYANARNMYSQAKVAQAKEAKTRDAAAGALRAVEDQALRALNKMTLKTSLVPTRKTYWFEKFNWFLTTEGYLVLSGRDAQQNDLLYKKYLRPQDIYVHADLTGASSCIVRSKATGPDAEGKTSLSPLALQEAGAFAVCRSVAWTHKAVSSAWWVYANQVSKSAPTGEYLTTGAFMIYGKKNYLPPSTLEMGFGIMFRLDDESVGRHLNDRKERDWGNGAMDNDSGKMDKIMQRYNIDLPDASTSTLDSAVVQTGLTAKVKNTQPTKPQRNGNDFEKQKNKKEENEKLKSSKESNSCSNNSLMEKREKGKEVNKVKNKKKARRYAEQDEEDRQMAMLLLGHKIASNDVDREQIGLTKNISNGKEKIAEAAAFISMLDVSLQATLQQAEEEGLLKVTELAEEEVRGLAAFPLDQSQALLRRFLQLLRDSFDGANTDSERKLNLLRKGSNKSAAFASIMRNYSAEINDGSAIAQSSTPRRENNVENFAKETETEEIKDSPIEDDEELLELMREEGILDEQEGRQANDTDKLTGCPLPEDKLLFAVPVCAPYASLQTFKYKIKLLPGPGKKGKSTRQAIQLLTQQFQPQRLKSSKDPKGKEGEKEPIETEKAKERNLILAIPEAEAMAVMIGDVKLSIPGLQQQLKAAKNAGKAKAKGGDQGENGKSASAKTNKSNSSKQQKKKK